MYSLIALFGHYTNNFEKTTRYLETERQRLRRIKADQLWWITEKEEEKMWKR